MTWIQTYSGRKFYPLQPRAEDVCLADIAHALANKCRYSGHCFRFFSVAQHSVMVSHMVPAYAARWGLLHDAGEAYLPDVVRPIKDAVWMTTGRGSARFRDVEDDLLRAVAVAFGLPWPVPPCVGRADVICLERERRQLMAVPPEEWTTAEFWDGDTTPIDCWEPIKAEDLFLRRWENLLDRPAG